MLMVGRRKLLGALLKGSALTVFPVSAKIAFPTTREVSGQRRLFKIKSDQESFSVDFRPFH